MRAMKTLRSSSGLCLAVLFVVCPIRSLGMQEPSLLWGRVLDRAGRPIAGAEILITPDGSTDSLRTTSDPNGSFRLIGLPSGSLRLRVEAPGYHPYEEPMSSHPGSQTTLGVLLTREDSTPSSAPLRLVLRNDFQKTVLDADHLRHHPSGNTLWNVIENQDLSATTSRIDVGGLSLGLPANISARGSSTWTQTGFFLNGFDITDPFTGGRPLFDPVLFSLSCYEFDNSRLPISSAFAGGEIRLVAQEAGRRPFGGLTVDYSSASLAADNVTPALVREGILESHTWLSRSDVHFEFASPLANDRLRFYASLTSQQAARDVADYDRTDSSSLLTGLLHLEYRFGRDRLRLFGIGQSVRHPSLGAGRGVAPEVTLDARWGSGVYQLLWETRFNDGHVFQAGLGSAFGEFRSDFQDSSFGPCRLDLLSGTASGSAPSAGQDRRRVVETFAEGFLLRPTRSGGSHLFKYGGRLKFSSNTSIVHILENRHLRFFQGMPYDVVEFNTPVENGQASLQGRIYAEETFIIAPGFFVRAGVHLSLTRGFRTLTGSQDPADSEGTRGITWLGVSPRLEINLPLSKTKDSSLSISAARYPFSLTLNTLAHGHPQALGGTAYAWNDLDQDFRFDEGERGAPLRREGPFYAAIDPDIKQPYTDEIVVAVKFDPGAGWRFALAGFLRETRNLLETLNVGVPFSSYTPVTFLENGDDLLPGTHDDLEFTLYDQDPSTLGKDFFLLTNPEAEKRISRYRGLDLTLVKRHGRNFNFFLSLQAIEAVGSAGPGNTEMENDDGVIGSLYDDPNTLVNAEGRLRFDRGYTARLGFSGRLPGGFRLAAVVKYYDGQPFARKIIVTGFTQGPFVIMAHPRGVARYEFNLTADVRLEKTFKIKDAELSLFLDGFNLFNSGLALSENEWTGPTWPLRYATEIQSPRVFRLGWSYRF